MDTSKIISLLGEQSEFLLGHTCKTIDLFRSGTHRQVGY